MANSFDGSLEAVRTRVANQPFSQLLGAEILSVSEESCELRLPIRQELTQHHGFMHGGAICYVADTAATIAGAQALRTAVVTSDIKVNYIRPGIGEAIIARAECLHAGRTQAVSRCNVYVVNNGEEKLCAAAQATIALLGPGKV